MGAVNNSNADIGAESASKTLSHYGIKGMRWGVRRRRTATGFQTISDDAASARKLLKGSAKAATNAEIQAALNRMRLESDFAKLQDSMYPASRTRRTGQFIARMLGDIGKTQTTRVVNSAVDVMIAEGLKNGGKLPKMDRNFVTKVGNKMGNSGGKKKKK